MPAALLRISAAFTRDYSRKQNFSAMPHMAAHIPTSPVQAMASQSSHTCEQYIRRYGLLQGSLTARRMFTLPREWVSKTWKPLPVQHCLAS